MYEHKSEPLLPPRRFVHRLLRSFCAVAILVAVSLSMGMAGYHRLERLPWIDAFLNASMIMSGMGPVDPMKTAAGKLFAGCYALYSGLALITASALILSPIVHRFFHRFHLENEKKGK